VREFLATEFDAPATGAELERLVTHAAGSIGAVLAESGQGQATRRAAAVWLEAVLGGIGPAAERALAQAPWAARGDFTDLLDAVATTLGDVAREAVGGTGAHPIPKALAGREPAALLEAQALVADAREAAQGNVNPQLLLAVLGGDLAEVL
jgi:hypothetical protein